MNARAARETGNFFGWLILAAALPGWGGVIGILRGGGLSVDSLKIFAPLILIVANPAFLLANAAAILLIFKKPAGFICLYVSQILGLFWLPGPVLPWLKYVFPAGPEFEYYVKAANIAAVLFLSFCHWKIAAESEPHIAAGARRVIIAFLVLLIPAVIFWRTGIRTGNGEVQSVAYLPKIGKFLPPLESTQPILFRSSEAIRMGSAAIVFRGMTSEKNIREFATAQQLQLVTNENTRTRLIPQARNWNLDPERFPVFTNETDLCFVGRIPTNSRAAFQLCFRPSDGRFTAMSMGNPNEARATNTAAPPQN